MEYLTSVRNPKVQAFRSLKDKKSRDEHHAFLVEGPKMVEEALTSPFPVQTLLLREGFTPVFALPPAVPAFILPDSVFQSVCDTKTPQGIAAVCGITHQTLRGDYLLALDGIQDPGNMGTILRTADAAGFTGVLLSPDCADVFSPKVVRATMGSIFRVGLSFPPSLPEALSALRNRGFSVVSSQLDGNPFFSRDPVPAPLVLIVGNEGNGISAPVRAEATHRFKLPMLGGAESLNAGVAAGIFMYELSRSRF